ncbi:MAG TPA: hypothetical protein VFV98_07045 [Vicinamibacterales bacterium]|nr:hypothetical protein [Vicinamibacterales bacterium]
MRRARKRWRAAVAAVAVAAVLAWLAAPYVASAAFLLDLAALSGRPSAIRRWLPARVAAVTISDLRIPTRGGDIAARLYQPDDPTPRTILLVPGVHAGGVDEPRLDALAQRLAGSGARVVSAPVPDLRAYRLVPAATDTIEDCAQWLAARADLTPSGRIAIFGVSFSGGLAIVAAGRPAIRDRVSAVISMGGHDDLPAVMRYLATGELADGRKRAPHDYPVAVMLRMELPRLVPAAQVAEADRALTMFLDASSAASLAPERAAAMLAAAATAADALPAPARDLVGMAVRREVGALGPRLVPHIEAIGSDPALSPSRSPPPSAPVFLVHGRDDNVIPATQLTALADDLRARGTRVDAIVTSFVSHAEANSDVRLAEALALVRWWKRVWDAVGR